MLKRSEEFSMRREYKKLSTKVRRLSTVAQSRIVYAQSMTARKKMIQIENRLAQAGRPPPG